MKVEETKLGLKIKFALPTRWCQVKDNSQYIWFKGRIIECNEKAIIVSGKNKKHKLYLGWLMCLSKNGEYLRIKNKRDNSLLKLSK